MIRSAGAVLLVLALAGCATPKPAPATAAGPAASNAAATGGGVIVALRPLAPDTPARRRVLAALGVAVAPAADDVEVIVRTDDGRPLSVMQGGAGALRAGERVALVGGPRIRIAPHAAP
jgi:outer membrane lipoprotein SlyB